MCKREGGRECEREIECKREGRKGKGKDRQTNDVLID